MTAVALRLGRNLRSLEYATDPANRATRLMPLMANVGGRPTYLGFSRWLVTDNTAHVLTLEDPAGGAPPVGFDDQLNDDTGDTWYIYRETTAQVYEITDSALSPNTVTVPSEPGIAVGEFVQFRTSATAGDPIAAGPGGPPWTLARGYVLPYTVTNVAGDVLTVTPAIAGADQWAGYDATFSAYVQTSWAQAITTFPTETPAGTDNAFPHVAVLLDPLRGADASGLAVDDWFVPSGMPALTIIAIDGDLLTCIVRNPGPAFNAGVPDITVQIWRPVVGSSPVTASTVSPSTITVDDATGWTDPGANTAALELSYTPATGEVPYYLDHPVYVSTTDPGIGVKFGTIRRQKLVGISNLSPNAYARNWTAGAPDGYSIIGGTLAENTDPLYTQLGGSSILVTFGMGGIFYTPTIPWRAAYPGQRFSVRAKIFIPDRWSGNLALEMRLGLVKADGSIKTWFAPDPVNRMVPPDYVNPASGWTAVPQGAFVDAVISGFDITAALGLGGPSTVGTADLADAVGYCVAFYNVTGTPPFYFDGISVTTTHKAPDKILEFGEANVGWQETNRALVDLAPPQIVLSAAIVDVERMNPALTPDEIRLGRRALVHVPSLGVVAVSQRMVEVIPNKLVPGDTRITLASRTHRLTQLLLDGQDATEDQIGTVSDAVEEPGQPPGGGTPPPSGTPLPAINLGVVLDTSNVPTATAVGNSVVTRVKFDGRHDRYPTADEVRLTTSVSPAPFTRVFAALASGQTQYVSALAYDTANNESTLAQAEVTSGSNDVAVPSAFWRGGMGYKKTAWATADEDGIEALPAATNGDYVSGWLDQSGNRRHFLCGINNFSFIDYTDANAPVRDANELRFGTSTASNGWMVPTTGCTTWWRGHTRGEVMIAFRAFDASPASDGQNALWNLGRAGGASEPSVKYPGADGRLHETFVSASNRDLGAVPGGVDLETLTVLRLQVDANTVSPDFSAWLNGQLIAAITDTSVGFPAFTGASGQFIGIGQSGGYWNGWIKHMLVFDDPITDDQADAWLPFMSGATDVAPTDVTGGTDVLGLTAVRSGGDVIITATVRFASSVKIDGSTAGVPSDADVRATDPIYPPRPFTKTFPAPTTGQTLHIKAFAYFAVLGDLESDPAVLDVPALAGTFGGTDNGDGTITVPVVTLNPDGSIASVTETTIAVGGFVPTHLLSTETFTVPANKQALFKLPIRVEGNLILRGDLLEVN